MNEEEETREQWIVAFLKLSYINRSATITSLSYSLFLTEQTMP